MPPSLLRFGQMLMLLGILAASGGHWVAFQTLAWTRMLVSYSQDTTFVDAVTKTFDGQHPCALCKTIEKGRGSQKQAPVLKLEPKANFVMSATVRVVRQIGWSWNLEIPEVGAEQRIEPPVAPPPRSGLA